MLVPALTVTFAATAIFILALRPFAIATGLVDRPGGRKQHIGVVPVIGGVAMFAGLFAGTSLLAASPLVTSLLVAGGLLIAVGVLDDRYSLPAIVRLGAQFVAVLLMFFGADVQVASLGNIFGVGDVNLGAATILITLLISISVINAFNLVDGVDGLAGTMGVLAIGPVAILTGYASDIGALATLAVAAILGFLCFNFPTIYNRPVRTFMGDAGSTLIGLIVVVTIAVASQGSGAVVSPAVGLWFAALPIFDLFTCFVRRIRRGKSPFQPGRDHFHHVLARSGLGVRNTLGILTLLQVTYLGVGLTGHYLGIHETVMFGLWSTVGLSQWWFIRKFAAHIRRGKRRGNGDESVTAVQAKKAA